MIRRPLAFIACLFLITAIVLMKLHPVRGCLPDIPEGSAIKAEGRLSDKQYKNNSYILVLSDAAPVNGDQCKNKILIILNEEYTSFSELPKMGSFVTVEGKYSLFNRARNPGEFDIREYYHIRGIEYRLKEGRILSYGLKHDLLRETLFRFRLRISGVYDSLLNEKDSGVLKAMILGDRTNMDPRIRDLYRENGIAHALSISGLHISILGYGLYRLLKKTCLGIYLSSAFCLTFISLYSIMTGGSTSTVRALIMFAVCLFSDIFGRTFDILSALSLSLMIILFTDPVYICDAGFMLSFGSVLGISLLLPVFREGLPFGKKKYMGGLEASLSITLFTLPITLYFYYEVPLFSILLNLLVVPLIGVLIISAILMGVLGLLILPLGVPFGIISHGILTLYERGCLFFSDLPVSSVTTGRPAAVLIIIYYTVIMAICIFRKYIKKRSALTVILIFLPLIFMIRTYSGVTYTMLDIGQGDCNVITGKGGRTVMIDCGSSSSKEIAKYKVIPFLKYNGISKVDLMVITHADSDHTSGFKEILDMEKGQGITIKKLFMPGISGEDEEYRALIKKAEEAGIPVFLINTGAHFSAGNMDFYCVWPDLDYRCDDRNEQSVVLRMEYKDVSALFTGDIQGEGEKRMMFNLKDRKRTDLLKTAHHGSAYSTPEDFLELIKPGYSLISAGIRNRYGHPHKELLERLHDAGSEIHITRDEGAIQVKTDGKELRILPFIRD